MTNYLSEAFKELDILNEDVFDLDKDGLEDLRDFQDEDEEEVIDVIDPEAETEEELEDSYIGKVILDCSVCHTDIYKDKEDVIIDEETQLANVGEECPYCFSIDGFKVIGEVKPFVETEFETEDDVEVKVDGEEVEEEEEEDEEKNESLKRKQRMVEAVSKRRNRKSLTEAPVYGLEPRYDARKSFYGKAQVDTGDNGDKNKLYSYGTLVAEIKDGKPVVYGTYSQTTLRHIKDWLKQNGFRADTSKQILADYGVKDEACSGRKSMKPVKEGWRGTPVKLVSHGSWGDPDLVWNNGEKEYTFNYWDIEDAMWNMFLEETGHDDSEANDPKVEAEFDEFVQNNYDGYLEDVIFGGYFDEGSTSWHDRYKRESLRKKAIKESRKPRKSINEQYSYTLHYNDIGNGRGYDYKVDELELFDYLNGLAWENRDAPEEIDIENKDEFDEWVAENIEYLFNKYYNLVLKHFRNSAKHEYRDRVMEEKKRVTLPGKGKHSTLAHQELCPLPR